MMPSGFWASVDPSASVTGLAYWQGTTLASVQTLRRVGAKGRHRIGPTLFSSRRAAWIHAMTGVDAVVIEEGFGRFAAAISSQGWMRGYVTAYAEAAGCSRIAEVNVSAWRRAVAEWMGVSWPRKSQDRKALGVKLVAEIYGPSLPHVPVCDDEADAILLGASAIRLGVMR